MGDGDIKLGAQLADMMLTGGWKYVEDWIKRKEKVALSALKSRKFADLTEVVELQAELAAYAMLIGDVKHQIEKGKRARERTEQ